MNTPRTLATIHLPATVAELQLMLAAFPRHARVEAQLADYAVTVLAIIVDVPEQTEQTGDVVSRQLVLNKLAQARDTSDSAYAREDMVNLIHFFEGIDNR